MKAAPPQQASLNEMWGSRGKKSSNSSKTRGKDAIKSEEIDEVSKDIVMDDVEAHSKGSLSSTATVRSDHIVTLTIVQESSPSATNTIDCPYNFVLMLIVELTPPISFY